MKIYLGDLGHYTIKLTNNCTPLNIGFIAAYVKHFLKDDVNIVLFRNPTELIEAIKREKPDMLALSNYVWCQSVSEEIFRYYKSVKKDGCAVWGGPNFPMNELHKTKQYLLDRPHIDFYIPFEGEMPVLNIVKTMQGFGYDIKKLQRDHQECFEGAFFISQTGDLVSNKIGIQIQDINTIPSPYLEGWMDSFLKEGQHPMFETQRGCPYTCTFCHTGLDYYKRGRSFSLERIKEEVRYISKKVLDPTKAQLHITDSNFGMWPQDLEFTIFLNEHYEKTGFPLHVAATTGKGRSAHVFKTVMSHPKLMLTNSVQSLDKSVLKAIKRKNLPLSELQIGTRELEKQEKLSRPEVILGLPEDSRKTHLNTLRKLMVDVGASIIYQYTLMLLPGTELYTDKMREKYQNLVKYRLLPTGYGKYEGKKCFEIEEVSVATKDLSFDEYLEMREIFFYVMNVYSNVIYQSAIRYLLYLEEDIVDFFLYIAKKRRSLKGQFPGRVVEDYMNDTQRELFDSREELIEHYSKDENYEKLLNGKDGQNLTHTYRTICLLNATEWAGFVTQSFREYVQKRHVLSETAKMINSITKHINAQARCQYQLFREKADVPSENMPLNIDLEFNVSEIFKKRITKEMYPTFKEEKIEHSYFMRENAIKYITSFVEDQRVVDLSLIILRMDPNYTFPMCKIKDGIAVQ